MKDGDAVWIKAEVKESPTGDLDAIVLDKDGDYVYYATVGLDVVDYKEGE